MNLKLGSLFHPIFRLDPSKGELVHRVIDRGQLIEVRENKRFRWLHFGDGNIQSAMDRQDPDKLLLNYMKPMMGCFLFMPQPQNITLLGLGGGGLVRHLAKKNPTAKITAIEINPHIVDIAANYFAVKADKQLDIKTADAILAIKSPELKTDLLLVDIYGQRELPPPLHEQTFYHDCHRALSERGLLVMNLLLPAQTSLLPILQHIKNAFEQRTLIIPIKNHGNTLIFAFKNKDYGHLVEQLALSGKLRKARFDMELGFVAQDIRH